MKPIILYFAFLTISLFVIDLHGQEVIEVVAYPSWPIGKFNKSHDPGFRGEIGIGTFSKQGYYQLMILLGTRNWKNSTAKANMNVTPLALRGRLFFIPKKNSPFLELSVNLNRVTYSLKNDSNKISDSHLKIVGLDIGIGYIKHISDRVNLSFDCSYSVLYLSDSRFDVYKNPLLPHIGITNGIDFNYNPESISVGVGLSILLQKF